MKKILPIIAILLSTVIFSCSSDNESSPETVLLTKININSTNGNSVTELTYDNDNKLIQYITTSNGATIQTLNVVYNGSGKVDEAIYDTSKDKYFYNTNGTIQKKENYTKAFNGIYTLSEISTYTYENKKAIENKVNVNDNTKTRIVAEFDAAGNLVKLLTYGGVTDADQDGELDPNYGIQNLLNYDNKKHPYRSLPSELLFPQTNINNHSIQNNSSGTTITITNEYDADGYAIKKSFDTNVITYEYTKK